MSERNEERRVPPVLGVTGGVASGKSTAAELLARRGAAVVDADRIATEVRDRAEVKAALADAFGRDVLDEAGRVVPQVLARRAFAEPDRIEELNRIMHPPIIDEVRRRVEEIRRCNGVPLIVLDAALLVETDLHRQMCDALLFVDTPEPQRRRRACEQRGMKPTQFEKRSRAQIAPEVKHQLADYVVTNDGSLQDLDRQLDRVWSCLVETPG